MKRRLSKSEMIGFIVLFVLILTITTYCICKEDKFTDKPTHILSETEIRELEDFSHDIQSDSSHHQPGKTSDSRYKEHHISPFPFDPNTADSATLSQLGLYPWQIENMLKYRGKGGLWKSPEDFQRLYGLSKEDYEKLKPYIQIKNKKTNFEKNKIQRDSIFSKYPKKYPEGTVLQINEADTTMLKGIPGIGSYYASKICRYRDRLGGFVSTKQIKEIEGLPEDIEKWFILTTTPQIRKIPINKTDFKGLVRHPYLNYEQTKAICNYIRKYGKIENWEQLSNNENFTKEDIQRLTPYISFE